MRYTTDTSLEASMAELIRLLNLTHIPQGGITCVRSSGSRSRRTLARIHTLPKILQHALSHPPHYVIEIVSENFDRLSPEEQTKTLIHELLHIPSGFGGGFRHHRPFVNRKTVEKHYTFLMERRRLNAFR